MGSLPRLKIKDEIRYRKGSTNESQNCRYCVCFNETVARRVDKKFPSRCEIIGRNLSARYRVRGDFTCDRQQLDEAKKTW